MKDLDLQFELLLDDMSEIPAKFGMYKDRKLGEVPDTYLLDLLIYNHTPWKREFIILQLAKNYKKRWIEKNN